MNIAVITLSEQGARLARRLADVLPSCDVFVHRDVEAAAQSQAFTSVVELTQQLFGSYCRLVYILPVGVAVRALAGCVRDKHSDPAVVVVDVGGRWAISLLSGHEGGANELAMSVANTLGAEPVVTTTTEAVKDLIVGVGCRRGTAAGHILAAVREAVDRTGFDLARVRMLASADIKANEAGLWDAARELALPLRLIPAEEIRHTPRAFEHSELVWQKVDMPAVAEPAALLAGRRTQLILSRQILHGVTVAVARENCMSWE